MANIHARIKQRRNELGYTLLYVAEKLGVKEATMQRYESGAIKNIKHDTIVKLADILNCNPAYLMGWLNTPNDNPLAHNVSCTPKQNVQSDITTLSQNERDLIMDYRGLSPQGQEYIRQTMFIAKQTYKKIDNYTVLEEQSGA